MAGCAERPELGHGEQSHEEVARGESDQGPVGPLLRHALLLLGGRLEGRGEDDPEEDADDLGEEAERVLDGDEGAEEVAEGLRDLDQLVAVPDQ